MKEQQKSDFECSSISTSTWDNLGNFKELNTSADKLKLVKNQNIL
jgi:hypothetical protein